MSDFAGEGGGYAVGQTQKQKTATGSTLGSSHSPMSPATNGVAQKPIQPRQVSTIQQELIERPLQDISQELKSFVNLNALLEINPQTDTAEEQARKQQLHSRWDQLSQEQQQIAQQTYQREMHRKQLLEQEAQRKAQQQSVQKSQLALPSSPAKGPVGPASGNKKKAAATQLQQNRQSFNKVSSSG